MSTAHTRRSRHLRLVYARHAHCVPASAGGYLERLVKHDGCEVTKRGGKPVADPARAARPGSCPGSTTLAERDQPLQGLCLAQAKRTAGRAPSRCDARGASARQARPESGRGCRALASFRADGTAPPRSTDTAGDAARRLRGRGFTSRRAGTHERNRAPRARDTARAIIDREVETAQTNGQPAPRTMHYHHDISGDSGPGAPGPNERNSRNSRDALAEEHERP
jgi:hypothetical protein